MGLSKRQSGRLATLLAVMSKEEVPEPFLSDAVDQGLVSRLYSGALSLTDKGLDEKNRLCTLAGLNIRYLSEVGKNAHQRKVAASVCGGDHGARNEEGATGRPITVP